MTNAALERAGLPPQGAEGPPQGAEASQPGSAETTAPTEVQPDGEDRLIAFARAMGLRVPPRASEPTTVTDAAAPMDQMPRLASLAPRGAQPAASSPAAEAARVPQSQASALAHAQVPTSSAPTLGETLPPVSAPAVAPPRQLVNGEPTEPARQLAPQPNFAPAVDNAGQPQSESIGASTAARPGSPPAPASRQEPLAQPVVVSSQVGEALTSEPIAAGEEASPTAQSTVPPAPDLAESPSLDASSFEPAEGHASTELSGSTQRTSLE